MASRAIKFSEKMKAKAAGEDLAEVPIAYDALAVVVHPSNPVKQLTRQQLEDIFRGKVTNWQQVGGDARIKTLAVSYDGQHYAAPTLENAINKTYPIVRPLYYYYNRKNASVVAPLLDFILSAAGQKIIKESGYIPVHKE